MDENMNTTTTPEEMIRSIGFGDNLVTVTSLYPYRYDYGKGRTVLRIEIPDRDITLEQVEELKNNTGSISYYENGDLKAVYEGYTADFSYAYQNGKYSVELQRVGQTEASVLENTASIQWLKQQMAVVKDLAEQAEADAAYAAIVAEPQMEL